MPASVAGSMGTMTLRHLGRKMSFLKSREKSVGFTKRKQGINAKFKLRCVKSPYKRL
jgi:hypothetical protein